MIVVMLGVPGWAQNGYSGYPMQGNTQAPQNPNYIAPGTIQPFQGLSSPANSTQPYSSSGYPPQNYPPAMQQPYTGQNYPPAGGTQFYQNPNYPLQGSMRIDRNSPYGMPGSMPPLQNNNYPAANNSYPNNSDQYNVMPQQGQNYQMPNYTGPGNMPPNLTTGYPMPGGRQPFASFLPSPNNISPAARQQAGDLVNKAYELSNAGNNEQAIGILKQAESMDPTSAPVHLDLSAAYMALKDYDDALHETSILLAMNPNDEKGYINYLAAAIGAGRMQDALRAGQDYLNRFPNGQDRTTLTNEMVAVQHELDRRANARGVMPPPGAPDNYLFYATPSGIRRWPPECMPLRVYINQGVKCKGFEPEFQTVLINSFLTWQNVTHGMMRFLPVDKARDANIECKWTDSADNVTLAAEAGEAKIQISNNGIYHVIITLLTRLPESPTEKLTPALLQQVSLHEIGHALGIEGHSDKAQDVMYCSTNPNVEHPQLTQRDINTLYLIYR